MSLMRKRVLRNKPVVVDGRRYLASVTASYAETVQLRVTIRADFATRSFATIHGLRNFDYFHHYGNWSNEDYCESTDTIAITPRMLAALIRYVRQNGWNPDSEIANRRIELTNVDAKTLNAEYNRVRLDDEARATTGSADNQPAPETRRPKR